ncbi:right-handed parallel beta-helix repeat-containing protein [Peribacillus simplex]|uniref:right-handed parallel beta-helix repeat-containing protein n=1 Tax=Peribacillus simplex TaxID=1478 RepID=UPI003D27F99D
MSDLKEIIINVKNFGAKGDGITDDTVTIQNAVNTSSREGGTIHFPSGTYMVNALTSIILKSNLRLLLDKNATIKAINNGSTAYSIFRIENISNVCIEDGTIIGDKATHTGNTGEWGRCFYILGSSNITLKNLTIKDAWGDCITIGGDVINEKIIIDNCIIDNARRNGITVAHAKNVDIKNTVVKNTSGTAPTAGIDIEPDMGDYVGNIIISNCYVHNNLGNGIIVAFDAQKVNITNVFAYSNGGAGIAVDGNETRRGKEVIIQNCHAYDNTRGVYLEYAVDTHIINCHAHHNLTDGIQDVFGIGNTIESNNSNYNTSNGISLLSTIRSTVLTNMVYGNFLHGIRVAGGVINTETSILNNKTIANATQNISLTNMSYGLVSGNYVRKGMGTSVSKTGINFIASVTNTMLMNNDCYDGGSDIGISTGGSNTMNGGNRNKDGTFTTNPN